MWDDKSEFSEVYKMRIRQLFAKEPVNIGRQDELDIVKGFAIVFMVWCHVYRELGADTTTFSGMMVDSILGGPFAAPMFMICMGVGICFSRKQEWSQFCVRGLKLIALGYALNLFRFVLPQLMANIIKGEQVIWQDMLCEFMEVDILQFAGLAFLLIGLARKMRVSNYLLLLFSAIMSVAGVLLKDIGTGILFPDLLLGLLWKTQVHTYFTLFHWFIFPVSGMIFGEWIRRCTDKKSLYKKLIPSAVPIMIVTEGGAILLKISLLDTFTEYFYMTLIDVVFLLGLFIFWAGILFLLHEKFPDVRITALQRMSRDINSIFCIHWGIIGILCAIKAIAIPEYSPGFIAATLCAAVVLVTSVWIAGKVRWKI